MSWKLKNTAVQPSLKALAAKISAINEFFSKMKRET